MLDYISKGPKTRLDMLAGQLEWKNTNQRLQVDLRQTTRAIGIATQGRHDLDQWVTRYKLQYGDDGQTFRVYKRNGDISDTVWKSMRNWRNLFAGKESHEEQIPFVFCTLILFHWATKQLR